MRPIVYEDLKVGDEVVTRDGRKGRVICTDSKMFYRYAGDTEPTFFPIVCLLESPDVGEQYIKATKKGLTVGDHAEQLHDIFLPPKKEYVNLYRREDGLDEDEDERLYYCESWDSEILARNRPKEIHSHLGDEPIKYQLIKTIEVEL